MNFWTILNMFIVLASGLSLFDAWRDGNNSAKWGWTIALWYSLADLLHKVVTQPL